MSPEQFWDHEFPVAIAHRGGMESAPENTLEAFKAAVDVGFGYLETDVHVTSDGVLVAFHDESLDRVTDRQGLIADLPYSEVAAARLGEGLRIPTLDELLDAFPDVRFNIDVKADDAVVPFAEALKRHQALERVCVGAFSEQRMRRIRSLIGPRLVTVATPREVTAAVSAAAIGTAGMSGSAAGGGGRGSGPVGRAGAGRRSPYQCLQVPVSQGPVKIVTRRFLNHVHSKGLSVHVWTVNDAPEMTRLLDLGVDGIFTDRPSLLKDVLVNRGQWAEPEP